MHKQSQSNLLIALLAMTLVAVTGCASASLEVSQRARDGVTVDRLYVLLEKGPVDAQVAEAMATAMETACTGHVAAHKSSVLTGMELDPHEVQRAITAFGANGVLILKPIGGELGPQGGTLEIVYAVALLETKSNQIIWRARAFNRGFAAEHRNRLTAEAIVAELVKEGVLHGGSAK
jgi:hypothetical protein